MSVEKNIAVVKDFFAAMGGERQAIVALTTPDIEWIIPGEGWPLAGTHRGHAGLQSLLDIASDAIETRFPNPPEYAAQGDRVFVVGYAEGTIKATGKAFKDDFVFAITIRDAKVARIREYVDTQALARAASPQPATSA